MPHLINYSKCQRSLPASTARETPISRSSSKWINGKKENGKRKEKWNTKCPTRRGRPGSRPFTQATYSSLALSPTARYKFKIKVRNSPSRTRETSLWFGVHLTTLVLAHAGAAATPSGAADGTEAGAELEATRLSFQSSLVLMYPQELGRGLAWRGHWHPVRKRQNEREREREKRKNRQWEWEREWERTWERATERALYAHTVSCASLCELAVNAVCMYTHTQMQIFVCMCVYIISQICLFTTILIFFALLHSERVKGTKNSTRYKWPMWVCVCAYVCA